MGWRVADDNNMLQCRNNEAPRYAGPPPDTLMALLNGTGEYASDFHDGGRDLGDLLTLAAGGGDNDACVVG